MTNLEKYKDIIISGINPLTLNSKDELVYCRDITCKECKFNFLDTCSERVTYMSNWLKQEYIASEQTTQEPTKYIIELEPINTNLYKAKGFNTLVFDENGIKKLIPYTEPTEPVKLEPKEFKDGDLITTPSGTSVYVFKGYSNDGRVNCINSQNKYTSISKCIHLEDNYTIPDTQKAEILKEYKKEC